MLLVSVSLSGCALDPPLSGDPDLGVVVPSSWVAGGNGGTVRDRWWQDFGDRELDRLVLEALAYNHDLKAAAGRVVTASGEARVAASALAPTLEAGLDGSRNKQVIDGTGPLAGAAGGGGGPAEFTTNSFGVSLNTAWEIDLWGRLRKSASAATADLRAVEADYTARALSLAGHTAKAWFSLTEARQQLALAERTLESYRKTRKQATDRADVGVQSPTDKHLAVSNAASAEALVEQRREAVARTSRQLETLIGHYPSGQARGNPSLPSVSPPPVFRCSSGIDSPPPRPDRRRTPLGRIRPTGRSRPRRALSEAQPHCQRR